MTDGLHHADCISCLCQGAVCLVVKEDTSQQKGKIRAVGRNVLELWFWRRWLKLRNGQFHLQSSCLMIHPFIFLAYSRGLILEKISFPSLLLLFSLFSSLDGLYVSLLYFLRASYFKWLLGSPDIYPLAYQYVFLNVPTVGRNYSSLKLLCRANQASSKIVCWWSGAWEIPLHRTGRARSSHRKGTPLRQERTPLLRSSSHQSRPTLWTHTEGQWSWHTGQEKAWVQTEKCRRKRGLHGNLEGSTLTEWSGFLMGTSLKLLCPLETEKGIA